MAQKQQNAQVSQSPILPVILTSEDGITYSGTPTQAGWNATAVGSNALINGVAGQKFRVVAMLAIASGSQTFNFLDGTTAISGSFNVGANGGFTAFGAPWAPFLQTGTASNALTVNCAASINVGGTVTYIVSSI